MRCSPAISAASSTSPAGSPGSASRSRRATSPRCWPGWPTRSRRSAPPPFRHSAIMEPTSRSFPANIRIGLADPVLQRALGLARTGFPLRRAQAIERLPEFEALRDVGRAIKDHTLAQLDFYLELYEKNVAATGGQVHWARNA